MSCKKKCSKWKTIIIHDENGIEDIQYDLDENQRLKQKMSRQKKRSLIESPYLKKERDVKFFIKEMIKCRRKTNIVKYPVDQNIIDNTSSIKNGNIDENSRSIIDIDCLDEINHLNDIFLNPVENSELENLCNDNQFIENNDFDELDLFFN